MQGTTLAEKLGTTTHLSPILRKANRLGLGQRELEVLAVQRGCRHYSDGTESNKPLATPEQFSNEELAMALLSIALPYSPHSIRCGAAMLGAPEAGRKFEPDNPFWSELLAALPAVPPFKSGVLPHPTRFVAMTGFTRRGPELVTEWQRPKRPTSHE